MDDRLVTEALESVLVHSKALLHALDRGYLAYKADSPESAFVAELRKATAIADRLLGAAKMERTAGKFAVPSVGWGSPRHEKET